MLNVYIYIYKLHKAAFILLMLNFVKRSIRKSKKGFQTANKFAIKITAVTYLDCTSGLFQFRRISPAFYIRKRKFSDHKPSVFLVDSFFRLFPKGFTNTGAALSRSISKTFFRKIVGDTLHKPPDDEIDTE